MLTPPSVGDRFEHDFVISQQDILSFATLTGDSNPLHVDPSSAGAAEFGGCIAHGVLILGVVSKVFGTLLYAEGNILLGLETRFLSPLKPGLRHRAIFTVSETFPTKSQVVYQTDIFEIDGDRHILSGSSRLLNRKQYVWLPEQKCLNEQSGDLASV
jgi:3-hydroxybutyryl-CoA dehydratase